MIICATLSIPACPLIQGLQNLCNTTCNMKSKNFIEFLPYMEIQPEQVYMLYMSCRPYTKIKACTAEAVKYRDIVGQA